MDALTPNPRPITGRTKINKIVSAAEALAVVRSGDTVATGGFVGIGFAEHLAVALEQRFLAMGERKIIARRAAFELQAGHIVNLERDILQHMNFRPIINGPPQPMDERIFRPEPMGLLLAC